MEPLSQGLLQLQLVGPQAKTHGVLLLLLLVPSQGLAPSILPRAHGLLLLPFPAPSILPSLLLAPGIPSL